MEPSPYIEILDKALLRLGALNLQQRALESEIERYTAFVLATFEMLSEEEAQVFRDRMREAVNKDEVREATLTEAVRAILQKFSGRFLTAAEVRNNLVHSGFNFSGYTSNPLASVSTTLRRIKPAEVETTEVNGVAAYKWIGWLSLGPPSLSPTRTMTGGMTPPPGSIGPPVPPKPIGFPPPPGLTEFPPPPGSIGLPPPPKPLGHSLLPKEPWKPVKS